MRVLNNGDAAEINFLLVLASDGKTGAPGLAATVLIKKSGGTFVAAANSATSSGYGWYTLNLSAAETNTNGDLIVHASGPGTDQTDRLFVVESATLTTLDTEVDTVQIAVSAIPKTPPATVTLDSIQPNYAPAKAGDAMTLTAAYESSQLDYMEPVLRSILDILNRVPGDVLFEIENMAGLNLPAIDLYLSSHHGSGSWQTGGGSTTLPADIATALLSSTVGSLPAGTVGGLLKKLDIPAGSTAPVIAIPAAAPGLCTIVVDLRDLGFVPEPDITILVQGANATVVGGSVIDPVAKAYLTDVTGRALIPVVKGITVLIYVPPVSRWIALNTTGKDNIIFSEILFEL